MSEILNTIENKLYLYNFQLPHNRKDACLALHAALQKNSRIPRVYLTDNVSSEEMWNICHTCLLTPVTEWQNKTGFYLHALHINREQLSDFDWNEKSEILAICEQVLADGWGDGFIHYENARFSPVHDDQLLSWIQSQTCCFNNDIETIAATLHTRNTERIECQKLLQKHFPNTVRKFDPSALSGAFENQMEKLWQQKWLDHSRYLPKSSEHILVDNLVFTDNDL